jgi:hypothetical protein
MPVDGAGDTAVESGYNGPLSEAARTRHMSLALLNVEVCSHLLLLLLFVSVAKCYKTRPANSRSLYCLRLLTGNNSFQIQHKHRKAQKAIIKISHAQIVADHLSEI